MRSSTSSSDRLADVAAETGYPVHEVRSRGVSFCRKHPRGRGGEFDQTFPDSFDVEVVEASVDDADALIAESRAARRPADNDAPSTAPRAGKILPNGSVLFTAPNGVSYAVTVKDNDLSVQAYGPNGAELILGWDPIDAHRGWLQAMILPGRAETRAA